MKNRKTFVGKSNADNKGSPTKGALGKVFSVFIIILLMGFELHGVHIINGEEMDITDYKEESDDPTLTYSQSLAFSDGQREYLEEGSTPRNVRGDNYIHPLTNDTTILFELDEIAIGTMEQEGIGVLKVYDDMFNQLGESHRGNFSAENELGADMVKGNFDSDLADEIVVAYELDFTENGENVSKTFVTFFDDANTGYKRVKTSIVWITYAALAVGDYDGDGLDEVAMVGNHQGIGHMAGLIYDDFLYHSPVLHTWDHVLGSWEDIPNVTREHDIASGDFDGDGIDEAITIGRINDTIISQVWKFQYNIGDTYSIYHGMDMLNSLPDINLSRGLPSVSAGNIDLDKNDELIITTHDENFKLYFRIHDDMQSDFEVLKLEKDNITIRTTDSTFGDIDGDGLDEIFVVGHHVANPVGRIYDDAEHDFAVLKVLDRFFEDRWYYWYNLQVDCGDVDGDGIQEYVISGQSWWQLHAELYDDISQSTNNTMIKLWQTGYKLPSLVMGNFDGDGFILEYTGEHESVTTSDIPLVITAAPPQMEREAQNTQESHSRFGISSGGQDDNGLSIMAELSLSFEEKPIELVPGTRSALLNEFGETGTPTKVMVNNISFEGSYQDDHVIFHNITYEVYKYRIVAWPGIDERVGEYITINVPLGIDVGHMPLDSFGSQIEYIVLSHEIGDLNSYPTLPERNSTLDDHVGYFSEKVAVGQGEGYTVAQMDLENEEVAEGFLKYGRSWDDFKEIEKEGFTSTLGISSGMMYEVSVGEVTHFEGSVGNFRDKGDFEKHGYSFGTFMYQKKSLTEGHSYLVMNYWVEDYEGHLESKGDVGSGASFEESLLLLVVLGLIILVVLVLVFSKRKKW
jgi:hypothetical protein